MTKKMGRPTGRRLTVAVTVYVDPDLDNAMRRVSAQTGVSVSFIARQAWQEWVAQHPPKPDPTA